MPDLTLGTTPARLTVWLVDAAPFAASVTADNAFPAPPELVFDTGTVWPATLDEDGKTAAWLHPAADVEALAALSPRRVTLRDPASHHVWAHGTVYVSRVVEGGTPSGVAPGGSITVEQLDGAVSITYVVGEGGPGGGVTDHGALTGLEDDDHPQYLTEQRGDARYDAAGTAAGLVGALDIPTVPGDIGAQPAGDYAAATHDHDGVYVKPADLPPLLTSYATKAYVDAAVADSGTSGSSNLLVVSGSVALDNGLAVGTLVGYRATASTTFTGQGGSVALTAGAYVFERTLTGWNYRTIQPGTTLSTGPIPVTPQAPTWVNDAVNGGGVWSTPMQEGVTYIPSGTNISAAPSSSVSWTATVSDPYVLASGAVTSWNHTFPATPAATYRSEVLADEPSVYFPLDDAPGTTTPVNLGTATGSTSITGPGITFGEEGLGDGTTAAIFNPIDAVNSYIKASHGNARVSPVPAWTIEAILKPALPVAGRTAEMSYVSGTADDRTMNLNGFANIQAYGTQAGAAQGLWTKGVAAHYVAVFDGAKVRYYRNGVQIATADKTPWVVGPILENTIVGHFESSKPSWAGGIAGFAVYHNRALPAHRVLAHAQAAGYAS